MPTYPSTTVSQGSKQTLHDDLVVDVWPSGASRGQSFFSSTRKAWKITHQYITSAQRSTLMTFYTTNKLSTFDFVSPFDGVTYTGVMFVGVPDEERHGGDLWTVTVEMRQQ